MSSDCPIELVAELPCGHRRVRCPQCGMERTISVAPENYHRQCPKGSNPPPVIPTSEKPATAPEPQEGVGVEFERLAKSLGFTACQLCHETAKKMNREGPAWCREHRVELVAEVKSNFEKIANGAAQQLKAMGDAPDQPDVPGASCADKHARQRGWLTAQLAKAKMLTGATVRAAVNLACGDFVPRPLDPVGSMIDEAIRRAEEKGPSVAPVRRFTEAAVVREEQAGNVHPPASDQNG